MVGIIKGLSTPSVSGSVKLSYIEFQMWHTYQASAAVAPQASKNEMGSQRDSKRHC